MIQRNECTMQLKLVHDTLMSIAEQKFMANDMTFSQINYLEYIFKENRPIPLKELEKAFKVSQPTVVGIVKRLNQKGLIRLEQSQRDYKAKNVSLTEKGKEVYLIAQSTQLTLEEHLYQGYTEEEVQTLFNLLERLYQNLKIKF